MNRYRITAVILFLMLATGVCMAQVDVPKTLGNVDVYGIKKFEIKSTVDEHNERDFTLYLAATTTNANPESLKLRNGEFEVIFQGQDGRPLLLGRTKVAEHVMSGKTGNQAGRDEMGMNVRLGPRDQETVQKILEIINIIGNPDAVVRILIRGKAEVGMKLPRGWVYEQGKKFEIELVFTPEKQRDWVLK